MKKLSMNTVSDIRDLYRNGVPIEEIAASYDISVSMVSAIINNVIYKETIPTRF